MKNGVLLRKVLGERVFSDEKALADLNRITHSAVKAEVLHRLESHPTLAAIDAIALFEGGLAPLCNITVAVTAPTEDRVRRLMSPGRHFRRIRPEADCRPAQSQLGSGALRLGAGQRQHSGGISGEVPCFFAPTRYNRLWSQAPLICISKGDCEYDCR